MAAYLDTLTVIIALFTLVHYSKGIVRDPSENNIFGLSLSAIYLLAQSVWSTSFLLGDTWGRDLAHYVWFLFNTGVFLYLLDNKGE